MNKPEMTSAAPLRARKLGPALRRGFCGRCPACGGGRLLTGFIRPVAACTECAENLEPYQTADFAPYLVTFAIGLVFTPLILAANLVWSVPADVSMAIGLTAALLCAMILLPRAKGAAIGLLWSLNVRANQ
jgi:uncharacterized protein (DUF983 family)